MLPSQVCLILRWNKSILDDILQGIFYLRHIISVQGSCPVLPTESVTSVQYKTASSARHTIKHLYSIFFQLHMLLDMLVFSISSPSIVFLCTVGENVLLSIHGQRFNMSDCTMWVSGIGLGWWTMSGRLQAEQNIPQALCDLLQFSNPLSTSVMMNGQQSKHFLHATPKVLYAHTKSTPHNRMNCVLGKICEWFPVWCGALLQ